MACPVPRMKDPPTDSHLLGDVYKRQINRSRAGDFSCPALCFHTCILRKSLKRISGIFSLFPDTAFYYFLYFCVSKQNSVMIEEMLAYNLSLIHIFFSLYFTMNIFACFPLISMLFMWRKKSLAGKYLRIREE